MYGKTYLGPARAAFILDRKGKVLAVIEKVDTKDHAKQLTESLKALS
jgi:peroxiredoxin Q/BCP